MLKTVHLIENVLDAESVETFEVENLVEFLTTRFDKWPDTGKIYHKNVSETDDVTPSDEAGVEKLQSLEGPFYCVIYPADFISAAVYIVAAIFVVVALATKPKIPAVSSRGNQSQSPNNELSSRANTPRVNGRIPDIFGTVRSTPDLVNVPYSVYINNKEVENALMCIGVGSYAIYDVMDGTTAISTIEGSSVSIFRPNLDISVSSPYYAIGAPIVEPVRKIIRNDAVNGQTLQYPNYQTITGQNNIIFQQPNKIQLVGSTTGDFSILFKAGDPVSITGAQQIGASLLHTEVQMAVSTSIFKIKVPSNDVPDYLSIGAVINLIDCVFHNTIFTAFGPIPYLNDCKGIYTIDNLGTAFEGSTWWCYITLNNPVATNPNWQNNAIAFTFGEGPCTFDVDDESLQYDLSGNYVVESVNGRELYLVNPIAVNSAWSLIPTPDGTNLSSPTITTNTPKWVGPFIMDQPDTTSILSNFVALNGLYYDNGEVVYPLSVACRLGITPVDINDNPTGGESYFDVSILGAYFDTDSKGSTLEASISGRVSVRACRVTEKLSDQFDGNIVDEVKWKDLYSSSNIANPNFGNVTLIRSKTVATSGALSLKERKLNLLVTREINVRTAAPDTFSSDLQATNNAAEIISFISLNQKIGNRQKSEIDFNNIYSSIADVQSYFGLAQAGEFCYTFDKQNLSFEETIQMVADAVFCTAYRSGNVMKLSFEKATDDSTMLFNHRNKIPLSETRTVSFGNQNANDGVEYEYVSPLDDAILTIYLPADKSAITPKKIESIGVRSPIQAYFHAWREYQKMVYQNMSVEFQATHEADLSIPTDRILVADNVRTKTQDGQVEAQTGLTIRGSQVMEFKPGVSYTIFLQLYDKSVQAIPVTAGPTMDTCVLSVAPRLPLALDNSLYAQTTYILVGSDEVGQKAFLITEKDTQENMTSRLVAINYDARFYGHDKDYINGII